MNFDKFDITPVLNNVKFKDPHWSDDVFKQVKRRLVSFSEKLGDQHEVGMMYVAFGGATTLHVRTVRLLEPGVLVFEGDGEDGSPLELIQHITQLNLLLIAAKRNPETIKEPKQPIGFIGGS